MLKVFKNDYRLHGMLMLIATFFVMGIIGCANLTPKKQLTTYYGLYNSQYVQYMTKTGWAMDETGVWKKVDDPVLTEEERIILRKKKKILTEMYPLVKLYDEMVLGTKPFSAKTEQDLLNLVDQLSKLVPG